MGRRSRSPRCPTTATTRASTTGPARTRAPVINLRSSNEKLTAADGTPRKCWKPSDGPVDGDDHFFQGDIGTHGLHLLFQVESDNARQTVPIDEIVSEQRMVMLPGQQGNVGEQYGREFEKPLVTRVSRPR